MKAVTDDAIVESMQDMNKIIISEDGEMEKAKTYRKQTKSKKKNLKVN